MDKKKSGVFKAIQILLIMAFFAGAAATDGAVPGLPAGGCAAEEERLGAGPAPHRRHFVPGAPPVPVPGGSPAGNLGQPF